MPAVETSINSFLRKDSCFCSSSLCIGLGRGPEGGGEVFIVGLGVLLGVEGIGDRFNNLLSVDVCFLRLSVREYLQGVLLLSPMSSISS